MGFDLMQNFGRPYLVALDSRVLARWHISLSTWFRDYVYIPLGGNRVAALARQLNLLIVFLLSGLWHGANWTFVIWGALHGACLIAARLTAAARGRIVSTIGAERFPALLSSWRTLFTFVVVSLGWVLFRASSIGAAGLVYAGLPTGWARLFGPDGVATLCAALAVSAPELALSVLFIMLLMLIERGSGDLHPMTLLARQRAAVRWPGYYALLLTILVFGVFDDSPFIYFQF